MGNSRPKASSARSPSLPTAGVSESGDGVSPSPGRYPLLRDSTYAVSSPKMVQGLVKVFIWSFLMERLVQWSLVGRSQSGRVGPLDQLGGTILAEGKGASDQRWTETRALLRGIATSVPVHCAPEDEENLSFSEVDCTRVSLNPWLSSTGFPQKEADSPRKDQGEQVNQSIRHMLFYEYAAPAFAYLRGVYGVSESEYRRSFQENSRLIALASNSKSPQSFMVSEDGKYLIKTASEPELESMLLLLPRYTGHVSRRRGSLLTQFFGVYRIADPTTRRSTVYMVSSNIFSTKKTLNEKYDLKGSIVGRRASPVPDSGGVSRKPSVVMKDLDLESRGKLLLAPGYKSRLMAELAADAEFLSLQGIMDYSLLVGIHRPKLPTERITGLPLRVISITVMPFRVLGSCILRRRGAFRPRPQIGIYPGREPGVSYYVGIIDVLQRYNVRKILERGAKGFIYNRDEISAVPPDRYRERFLDFIDANME